jgi:hypothetical protein
MKRSVWFIALGVFAVIILVIVVTAVLTPTQTNPAAGAALEFVLAVSQDVDTAAQPLMSDELTAYVSENCPDQSVSACIAAYIPVEWGEFVSAVFRRAAPEGDHWNVDLISTYQFGLGGSGVCIYARVEQDAAETWKVAEWAGFVNCADPATRNMATNPDAPNRVP